ncbi:SNF2-like protein [Nitritalea halalkaliphila LW7]|uniref:SNF2-like protein n=1 Tax=Nitritalea halalkaliphila LW7 TaxID=1189621 RepID=I5C5F1_9BACT|nr:DEAD/DEAH box helicase [Nitritalea halalkaliphila]EIM77053.1 SNF2-like protein [Nitritalea halalkaliphila LW7]
MKVSAEAPHQLIYSLFEHEYLGLLFESFVVQLNEKGKLSFAYQNISYKNAHEFAASCDEADYKLIRLMDSMQQEEVVKPFNKKKLKPKEFLRKIFDPQAPNQQLIDLIRQNMDTKRAQILELLRNKRLFVMGSDGNPTWKEIEILPKRAQVLFHFMRNEEVTHYWPTIKYQGELVNWQFNSSYLICHDPAWMIAEDKLYSFKKGVDGYKLKPFFSKKRIIVKKAVEEVYYKKFITQLVSSFDVHAEGFDIIVERSKPQGILTFMDFAEGKMAQDLFGNKLAVEEESKIVFTLHFQYGSYRFRADNRVLSNAELEKIGDEYTFYKVVRDPDFENQLLERLKSLGLHIQSSKAVMKKTEAFDWLNRFKTTLEEEGLQFVQRQAGEKEKRYFVGHAKINIRLAENIDWFDVHAVVKFGEHEIPFHKIRKYLIKGVTEFELPNGEIAVIPRSWFVDYGEIFSFLEEETQPDSTTTSLILKKHHIALAQELNENKLLKVSLSDKLRKLQDFTQIEDYPLSTYFKGKLRPYQQAGYNWLRFLNEYSFGGCLADDMGLGKTVQTLALLAHRKEAAEGTTSLLIMPTSLIYNWEVEAKKFTPKLKVLVYAGTHRIKRAAQFSAYDVVLTSYGITRIDIEILKSFYFDYIILDESQAIKNPGSRIAKAVNELHCNHRLILTGTPVENGTMDLWSQMNFINPGLLGNQNSFKKQFLLPIEKQADTDKIVKLHATIKPFILRRLKTQVATDLPEKVINVRYSSMTAEQEKVYEEVKSRYREKIAQEFSISGLRNQQFTLLRGLTQLRQLANHPRLVDKGYTGDSGKLEDVIHMLDATASEGHKVLVFSQFVRHLAIIREYLEEKGMPYAYLDGTTKDRREQVTKFQEDKEVKVFLISLKAGGVGLNLTAAEYVFLLDPWWNPAVEAQAIDRAHRIGQENKVIIYKFISKETVEEKIMALQERKLALAGGLISTEESFMKSLSKEDIDALLD